VRRGNKEERERGHEFVRWRAPERGDGDLLSLSEVAKVHFWRFELFGSPFSVCRRWGIPCALMAVFFFSSKRAPRNFSGEKAGGPRFDRER
jgi:hypothetical protein